MSHHISIPNAEKFDATKGVGLRTVFQILLAGGVVGAGVVAFFDPQLFAHSWLFAFFFAFTITVGAFFWNCVHHATDAEWSVVVRRQMENIAGLLKWVWVVFIPIAIICIGEAARGDHPLLYGWFGADPHHDTLLAGTKSLYLNQKFFWFRAIAFFVLLGLVAHILRSRSMAQDADGASRHTFTMRKAGVAGIPLLAICLTFGGIDWLKAMNHHWYSTMWGVYLFAGAAGSSMAVLVLACKWLQSKGYLKPVTEEHWHLMGKWLFAFTVFWAYIGFAQYMLITYANLEEETIYFRVRNTGSWNWLSWFLVFGRFFFMFVPLLFQGMKKTRGIIFCASWIIFMQFLDSFIIIIPEYSPTGFTFGGLIGCAFALAAVVGGLGLIFLKHLGQGYIFPVKDPRLAESLKFSN